MNRPFARCHAIYSVIRSHASEYPANTAATAIFGTVDLAAMSVGVKNIAEGRPVTGGICLAAGLLNFGFAVGAPIRKRRNVKISNQVNEQSTLLRNTLDIIKNSREAREARRKELRNLGI